MQKTIESGKGVGEGEEGPRKMRLAENGIAYKKVGSFELPSIRALSDRRCESRQSMNNILSRSNGWPSTCKN
jgi:hypothetical protein